MSDVTRDEFNGLGTRVNNLQGDYRELEPKVERNEKDISGIFIIIGDFHKTVYKMVGAFGVIVVIAQIIGIYFLKKFGV